MKEELYRARCIESGVDSLTLTEGGLITTIEYGEFEGGAVETVIHLSRRDMEGLAAALLREFVRAEREYGR